MHQDIEQILLSEEEILAGIDRLAREVTEYYRGGDLTVVSVLKGSFIFASDLIRRIPIPLHLAFLSARSYGEGTTGGPPRIELMPSVDEVVGKRVLLVDDILDTGRTLSVVEEELVRLGTAEVKSCVFLDKPVRRQVEFRPDWACFTVDDHFVVGYGLDYAGRYRNLPFVASLKAGIHALPVEGS